MKHNNSIDNIFNCKPEKIKLHVKVQANYVLTLVHAQYLKAKIIAEKNFLACMQSKKVRGIIKLYPDIGEVIESYIKDKNVRADVCAVLAFLHLMATQVKNQNI